MHFRSPQLLRQYLLIALMAVTLVGVQLLQASPLHEHTQHSVDCALCHLQLSDDALLHQQLLLPIRAAGVPVAAPAREVHSSSAPSPYQGRAPPRSVS